MAGTFPELSRPELSESQLAFRIGLARKRLDLYPLDRMDFILMDLERPPCSHRHADQCTGDLTGRVLEFWSAAEGIDGSRAPRLGELFERILRTRQPSGLFGRANGPLHEPVPVEEGISAVYYRLFPGLIHYWRASGDSRALAAAVDQGEWLLKIRDRWSALYPPGARALEFWATEPMAMLYQETGDTRYLDFVAMIEELIGPCEYTHSHGYMATMRGLQLAALATGDPAWNRKPEAARRSIIDRHYQMVDGCVAENHPRSFRNEGCSIADWLMMNLNAGRLGQADGYDEAENILWNALFGNQLVTGGFGHRDLLEPDGYSMGALSEAWWCCTMHAGLAMCEYARHAVTSGKEGLRINFQVPGTFRTGAGTVRLASAYPARAESLAETAAPRVTVRRPNGWRAFSEERRGERIVLSGRLGHWVDRQGEAGDILRYGPLVLAPLTYYWGGAPKTFAKDIPAGYVPDFLPAGRPRLLTGEADADGLLTGVATGPLPEWSYFECGPDLPLGVEGASAYIDCRFPQGEVRKLWFSPLCHLTSNLSYYDTPILWSRD